LPERGLPHPMEQHPFEGFTSHAGVSTWRNSCADSPSYGRKEGVTAGGGSICRARQI
jgi:hypothetical protein